MANRILVDAGRLSLSDHGALIEVTFAHDLALAEAAEAKDYKRLIDLSSGASASDHRAKVIVLLARSVPLSNLDNDDFVDGEKRDPSDVGSWQHVKLTTYRAALMQLADVAQGKQIG